MDQSTTVFNQALYDEFWESCPDFNRYNPGVLHRRRAILARLKRLRFESLLDVGCGNGELIHWLRAQLPPGVAYSGADLSPKSVERNRQRHPHAQFHVLNIESDRLKVAFDVIVCTEVIEHLDNQRDALANLRSMLAPGGHLIVTCPTGKVHATERHFGHVRHPTAGELRALAESVGLEVVALDSWGFPVYTALKYATNARPEWALRNFAEGKYGLGARLTSRFLYYLSFLSAPVPRFGCQLFLVGRAADTNSLRI